nr:zinc finger MYM-type protein 1-like [Aegilops tauschii subsp. strangulata]
MEEVIAFGGIPDPASVDRCFSHRIQSQPDADDIQMGMRAAKLRDIEANTEMKRKTLHYWFASTSNTNHVVVPEPAATQIPNLNHLTPTIESSNPPTDESTIPPSNESTTPPSIETTNRPTDESTNQPPTPKLLIQEFHPSQIFGDPVDRIPIEDYAPKIRSEVRRAYLLKGRNKAEGHNFEITLDGTIQRSFQPQWLDRFDWLEYSVKKEAAYCFHCFLFKKPSQVATFGNDVFTLHGYRRWKTALGNFQKHIGGPSSYHNNAIGLCDDFKNQRANVATRFRVYNKEAEIAYKIHLTASLDCARYLIAQGEAFRGHDESFNSINKGNFRELLDWYKCKRKDVEEAFDKGQDNALMICGEIQKDLAACCAMEVTKVIKSELGHKKFSVLVD